MNRLFLLAVLTVALGVAAWVVTRDSESLAPNHAGRQFFPRMLDSANDVGQLTVQTPTALITVRRSGEDWIVDELGGYPASFDTVKGVILGLASLTMLEPKTNRTDSYAKLGVEGPEAAAEGGTSLLLTVAGTDGVDLAQVIVGNVAPGNPTGLYVRKSLDSQSWLVAGSLRPPSTAVGWIDTEILDLALDRMAEVVIEHADGEVLSVSRADKASNDWTLHDLPAGREPSYANVGRNMAGVLSPLQLEDVRPAAEIDFSGDGQAVATLEAFDGLVAEVTTVPVDEVVWAHFEFRVDAERIAAAAEPDTPVEDDSAPGTIAEEQIESMEQAEADAEADAEAMAAEVAVLNERLSPWAFALPEWKAGNLRQRMQDVTKAVEPPPEPDSEANPDG